MRAQGCTFCGIAEKTVPAALVAETDRLVALLDIQAIRPGHAQIVPREHHAHVDELRPDLLSEVTAPVQRLSRALKSTYGVERVGFSLTSEDIAHAHDRVVPLVAPDDLTSPAPPPWKL